MRYSKSGAFNVSYKHTYSLSSALCFIFFDFWRHLGLDERARFIFRLSAAFSAASFLNESTSLVKCRLTQEDPTGGDGEGQEYVFARDCVVSFGSVIIAGKKKRTILTRKNVRS